MARYIHCEKCNQKMIQSAKEFGEFYESIEGKAKGDMACDGCTPLKQIKTGDTCFAAVLLNSCLNPNYRYQNPKAWAHEFIEHKQ